MTGTPVSPLQKGWKPSAYQAAVVLSGLSAVLGLGREALVLRRLGLSAANDALQLALSITYTIALLGEPLRLAALNLLPRRLGAPIWGAITSGILLAAAVMTLLYRAGGATLPVRWLLIAGSAGAANLFLAWVLPRRQRSGPFLLVHFVTVMPNIFMVAGLLMPAASDQAFAERVVGLFLLTPLLQLVALAFLTRLGDHPDLAPEPSISEGLRPMAWHTVGAAGGQGAQLFLRTALAAAPTGTLTAFTMTLRVTETLRAIFVDTYIASRVRRWAAGERGTSAAIDGRWLSGGGLIGGAAGALLIAWLWTTSGRWVSPSSAMLLVGGYLVLALRVRYQSLNTSAQPMGLVKRMAGIEIATATAVGMASVAVAAPLAVLPWLVYVAKPAAGLGLIASRPDSEAPVAPES
ncbi:MAG TPA: hypothetical protein VFU23_14660 [Gemmatimonadales bacterium]|nr:hypothetical protein [Gemmatimonadales bacterium]